MVHLVKNTPAMWETWVQSLGLGRSPGEGNGSPLQYSGLENSMDCIQGRYREKRERKVFSVGMKTVSPKNILSG